MTLFETSETVRMRRKASPPPSSFETTVRPTVPPRNPTNHHSSRLETHKQTQNDDAVVLDSRKRSFHLAKWSMLRLVGIIYWISFLGAYYQNIGLMGEHGGLLPATKYFQKYLSMNPTTSMYSGWSGFLQHPTLFWFIDLTDDRMQTVAMVGMGLSGLVVLGLNSWFFMTCLWLLHFSIVTIAGGTSFYNYGWESQLLETGFLAIFLCELPYFDKPHNDNDHQSETHSNGRGEGRWKLYNLWRDGSSSPQPSFLVLYLFRWLCFRISLGAGLIKIRGSSCWAQKTCLWYHFETQPIPSPLSFFFHFLPKWMLTRAVDLDLIVQLYTSWFVLIPGAIPGRSESMEMHLRSILRIGGFMQIGFMLNIILSGNFAFLNHLTIVPALACLDDACWPSSLHRFVLQRAYKFPKANRMFTIPHRKYIDISLFLLIMWLSMPVVTNLLQLGGSRQVMNGSFDRFRLVNTYGAFGDVGKARFEPIVSVSTTRSLSSIRMNRNWTELEFPCKPGRVTRRPCFCAPYHYRLDWNIWFIGFPPHVTYLQRREGWLYTLLEKILTQPEEEEEKENQPWLDLLDVESASYLRHAYRSGNGPIFAKVDMYHYRMAAPLWTLVWDMIRHREVVWWERRYKESLIPIVQLDPSTKRLAVAPRPN